MIATQPGPRGRGNRSLAQLERDAALGRIGRTRRWLIVAAAGLTAGFAALVSAVAPGKSYGARTPTGLTSAATTSAAAGVAQMPPLASPSSLGLQGPAQAPQADASGAGAASGAQTSQASQASSPGPAAPAPAPAPAVSGGS